MTQVNIPNEEEVLAVTAETQPEEVALPTEMKLTAIVETIGDYSRVIVARDIFNAVSGFNPKLPYLKTQNTENKEGVRVFEIGGVKLYSRKPKDSQAIFIMHKDDAERLCPPQATEKVSFAW